MKDNDKSKAAADSRCLDLLQPLAQNTPPVANKAAAGKYSYIFVKANKLNNMNVSGLQMGKPLECFYKQKDPTHNSNNDGHK